MMEGTVAKERAALDTQMRREHERLDALYAQLRGAFAHGVGPETSRLWSELTAALEAHMAQEDRQLIPSVSEDDPEQARQLLREHDEVRQRMRQIGVGVELNVTSAEAIALFIHLLRSHARREEAMMFRWLSSGEAGLAKRPVDELSPTPVGERRPARAL